MGRGRERTRQSRRHSPRHNHRRERVSVTQAERQATHKVTVDSPPETSNRMKVNFSEEIKKDEQDFDLGGDYFKFEVGANRIRICSPMVGYESVFKDKT